MKEFFGIAIAAPLLLFVEVSHAQVPPIEPLSPIEQSSPTEPLSPTEQLLPQLIQITDVTVAELGDGLQLILTISDPNLPEVFQFQEQNRLVIDITGAQLALPNGNAFQQLNPIPTVSSLTLEQRDDEVQITVVGAGETAPNAYLERAPDALRLDIVTTAPSGVTTAPDFERNNLRIIVAASPLPRYRVPNATTGTRTDTPISDIAQSIQVIPQAVFEDQGRLTLGDALRSVSGVSSGDIASDRTATSFVIRGFETNNILRNGLRDDTQRFLTGVTNIEQIEILKGPASVLFGSGNPGGTVNLVTERPLSEPRYEVEFTAGSFNRIRPSLDFTGPLDESGSLAYRLNVLYDEQDNFRDFQSSELFFVAPSIALIDTDRTSWILDVDHFDEKSRAGAPELPAVGTILDSPFGEIDISTNLGEPSLDRSRSVVTRVGWQFAHEFNDNWSIKNDFLAAFLDFPQSTTILPVSLRDDGRTLVRALIENPSEYENYTINTNLIGRFNTGSIEHQLLLGVEWAREKFIDQILFRNISPIDIFDPVYRPDSVFPPLESPLTPFRLADTTSQIDSWGLYIQDQITVFDNLILALGGRFDFADLDFLDTANQANPTQLVRQEQVFSPRVGLVYKPVENISLFAGLGRSYEPSIGQECQRDPATNLCLRSPTGGAIPGQVLDSERGTQFELGVKATWLDERLSTTLSYFDLSRTNFLVQDPVNLGFQIQLGEQRSRGVELDVAGELLPGWNVIATYTYIDAIIAENDIDSELEGNRLQNVPEHSASLWTTYQIQAGLLEGLGFGLGLVYEGKRFGDLENTLELPSYVRPDAAVFYRRGRLGAQVNFQNLFNLRYFESARNDVRVNPGAPFTVLGKLSWEF